MFAEPTQDEIMTRPLARRTRCHLWGICCALLLLAPAAGCDEDPPPVAAPDELGAFGVGHLSFTAVDPDREDRSLLVDVWYPVDDADWRDSPATTYPLMGPIGLDSDVAVEALPVSARADQPLLVFSHGYGGINIQSTELMETLASHGFIVAAPEHTGNAQASMTDTFDEAAANRVPDVSFVIDTMLARSGDPADPFFGRLDHGPIGVVGHSFGGMTSLGMAAGWAGSDPDPRVEAIAPISAVIDASLVTDGTTVPNAGFTEAQLSSITIPVLLLGGTADTDVPIQNNEIAYAQLTSAPVVYKVDVIGANHTHFANVCAIGDLLIELNITQDSWESLGAGDLIEPYNATCTPDVFPIAEAIRLQNLYVVSFFRRHLLGDTGYDAYLSPDYAATEPAINFESKQQ